MLVLKHLAPQLGRRLMMLRWCSLACGAVSRLCPAATGLWFSFRRCASSFRGSFRFVDSTRETGRKRSRPHSRLPGGGGEEQWPDNTCDNLQLGEKKNMSIGPVKAFLRLSTLKQLRFSSKHFFI